jgi:glucokinase
MKLGVDIGGGSIKLACLHDSRRHELQSQPYRHPSLDELVAHLQTLRGQLPSDRIDAAGACIAGPMDEHGVVTAAANLPALVGVTVGRWLADRFALPEPAPVISDTEAAARAEHATNPCEGRTVYLSIGTGVGAAVLDGEIPLCFTRGTPGHLGHIDVSGGEDGVPSLPGCGRGALEAYIGAAGLRQAGVDPDDPAWPEHPAAQRGIAALIRALRTILLLYHPQRIVLLGGVGLRLESKLNTLEQQVRDGLSPAAPARWTLTCGRCGRFAAAWGAMP